MSAGTSLPVREALLDLLRAAPAGSRFVTLWQRVVPRPSRVTLHRHLRQLCEEGVVRRTGWGCYILPSRLVLDRHEAYAEDAAFRNLVDRLVRVLEKTGVPLGYGIVEDALEMALAVVHHHRCLDDDPHPTLAVGVVL